MCNVSTNSFNTIRSLENCWWVRGGQTQVEVATANGVAQSFTSRIWNRFLEIGNASPRLAQDHRCATTPNKDCYLTIIAQKQRNMNATLLPQHLRSAAGTTILTQIYETAFTL